MEDRVRAVLFFEESSVNSVPYVQQLIKREQGNVAVVGGKSHQDLYAMRHSGKGILGMAVCGENVTAASVVISTSVMEEEMTRQAMSKFLKFYDPNKTSVAFFITCIGRIEDQMWCGPAYEVKMFRKMYPTTPVFGAFVYGETCFEFLPHPPGSVEWQLQQEKNKKILAMSTNSLSNVIECSYSTCILFLQFE
ncbi:F-box only protein 22-like [Hyalella azteca]|uniref:F-box only protein 22-like n=1 Tax=Hyalella azteca TaxID=294128 RepID=A0A8B7PB43_HYAAZ|nr:F-box only protein 22-like [Hyalella azteca]